MQINIELVRWYNSKTIYANSDEFIYILRVQVKNLCGLMCGVF